MIELENYKAGHFEKQSGYKYFVPNSINDELGMENTRNKPFDRKSCDKTWRT